MVMLEDGIIVTNPFITVTVWLNKIHRIPEGQQMFGFCTKVGSVLAVMAMDTYLLAGLTMLLGLVRHCFL
jgi:hypothetical protein